jgi:hypothetical protein
MKSGEPQMSEQEVLAASQAVPGEDGAETQDERIISARPAALRALLALFAFGTAGALVGVRTVARTTLPHILLPPPSLDYQNVTDGQPISRLLDWNQGQIDVMLTLRELNGVWLSGAACALYGLLAVVVIRLLNPNFRLFRVVAARDARTQTPRARRNASPVVAPEPGQDGETERAPEAGGGQQNRAVTPPAPVAPTALNAAIQPDGLIKALKILALLGLPLAAIWLLTNRADVPFAGDIYATGEAGRWGWVWALRMPLAFAALWAGFSPQGLAGNARQSRLHFDLRRWPALIATGLGLGLAAFLIGRYCLPVALEPSLLRYHTLGAFNVGHWRQIGGIYLTCMVASWAAMAALICAVSIRNRTVARAMPVIALLAVGVALRVQTPLSRKSEETRLDTTPTVLRSIAAPYDPDRGGSGVPNGPPAAELLAPRLGLKPIADADGAERPVVLFRDDSNVRMGRIGAHSIPITVIQNGFTMDFLPYDAQAESRAVGFLRERRFQSALSWVATKYRAESAAHRFDITAMLTACLDDLAYGPHPNVRNPMHRMFGTRGLQVADTVQDLLCICAVTPQNRALLDRWANLDLFAFPDRQSKRLIGDLYRRFGDAPAALAWYRRAEMPHSFINRIRAEQPLFHAGHVQGVFRLNGRPLAGVQVGATPERMNGLPHGLEGLVNGAIYEMIAQRPSWPRFGPFHPVPNAFRWVSASTTTDANGAFTLDGLTEGEYTLICTLPTGTRIAIPMDANLHISNPPLPFNVHYGNPSVDLGIIDMRDGRR